jgi:hypothetical protein
MSYLHKIKYFLFSTALHVLFGGFPQKVVLIKAVHPLKVSQHTKSCSPAFPGSSLASISQV